jgi:hypothetical protein
MAPFASLRDRKFLEMFPAQSELIIVPCRPPDSLWVIQKSPTVPRTVGFLDGAKDSFRASKQLIYQPIYRHEIAKTNNNIINNAGKCWT